MILEDLFQKLLHGLHLVGSVAHKHLVLELEVHALGLEGGQAHGQGQAEDAPCAGAGDPGEHLRDPEAGLLHQAVEDLGEHEALDPAPVEIEDAHRARLHRGAVVKGGVKQMTTPLVFLSVTGGFQ